MLVTWGFAKACIKVSTETHTLTVAGMMIAKATVKDYQLKLEWSDGEWESWEALQQSGELAELKKVNQDKLHKAKDFVAGKGKGDSKGKASQ